MNEAASSEEETGSKRVPTDTDEWKRDEARDSSVLPLKMEIGGRLAGGLQRVGKYDPNGVSVDPKRSHAILKKSSRSSSGSPCPTAVYLNRLAVNPAVSLHH